jgi:hypothetical protein
MSNPYWQISPLQQMACPYGSHGDLKYSVPKDIKPRNVCHYEPHAGIPLPLYWFCAGSPASILVLCWFPYRYTGSVLVPLPLYWFCAGSIASILVLCWFPCLYTSFCSGSPASILVLFWFPCLYTGSVLVPLPLYWFCAGFTAFILVLCWFHCLYTGSVLVPLPLYWFCAGSLPL